MAVLPTPLKFASENGQSLYPTEIKYEIITSNVNFEVNETDSSGFGFFQGILHATRDNNSQLTYSLIIPQNK